MKKLLTGIAAASVVALAVGTAVPATAASKTKTLNIQMVSKGFQHQFWQAVKLGALQAGKSLNAKITFVGPESETMIDKQLEQLQAALDSKPDAIGYASLDPKAPLALLAKIKKKNIPVYEFDASAGVESTLGPKSPIAMGIARTDGVAAGALAADKMAALIGDKGKVFVICHSQVNATGIQRRDGFVNQMKAKHPGVTVLPVQYGDGDHQKSADIVKAVIAANSDLAGIYATNEGSAIGAVNAFTELKLTAGKIKLIGFDSGAGQINAIKSGMMQGAITQDPIGIGKKTVQALVNYVRNKKVPAKFIDTGFYYYDNTNLTDPKIAAVLYQ